MKYTRQLEAALVFACQLHNDHFRKATEVPYVTHLLGVASLVGEAGGNEDEVIAALLHDAVEDQGGQPTLERIRDLFGDEVADIVLGCSDTDEVPKPPWQQRKEAYIQHLDDASGSILLVSCADKLHNARSIVADYRQIGDELWDRFTGTKEQTLWYYRSLVEAFRRRGVSVRLVDELDRTVLTMEDLVRQSD
jgi:(p)ppGpp synthase/HD superfamily hydrolase